MPGLHLLALPGTLPGEAMMTKDDSEIARIRRWADYHQRVGSGGFFEQPARP
jgi:hypothetical protein